MEYRQLGNSGVRVSVIGIGTNRFGSEMLPQKEVTKIVDAAVDLGINHIDTSNSYQKGRSEECLGEALQQVLVPHGGGYQRSWCFALSHHDCS